MIHRAPFVLLVVALLASHEGVAAEAGTTMPLSIETWSSSLTALQPEVHALLTNGTDQPLEFLLQFGAGASGEGLQCDPVHRGVSDQLARSLSRRSRAALSETLGVVPAKNGWTHRSFLAGLSGGGAPCRVSYWLTVRNREGKEWRTEGVIDVDEQDVVETGIIDAEDLKLMGFVEEDRSTRQRRALLRVLVRNSGRLAASIGISDIRLSCPGEGQPRRDLHYSTLQGEDVGPRTIRPSAAHVFVVGIGIPPEGLSDCRGEVDIAAFERGGPRSLTTFRVDLEPRGFFDLGGHGFGRREE